MTFYRKRISKMLSRSFGTTFFLTVLVAIVSLSLTSCDRESTVGLGVQPVNDLLKVGYHDTTTLFTKTVVEDSLRTDQGLLTSGIALIGKYQDPIFGEADASLYTQVQMTTNSPTFGVDPICDSIVLSLVYAGNCYGKIDKNYHQTLNVYELLDPINSTKAIYSDSTLNHLTLDLASHLSFVPNLTDSVHADNDTLVPQLRVPLLKQLGQTILNNQYTGMLVDNATFQAQVLKGLYITTANTSGLPAGEGNIITYNMALSTMKLYYHNGQIRLPSSFTFSLNAVNRYSYFNHNYAGTDIQTQLHSGYNSHFATCYVQSIAGVKTKIKFPYLMNLIKNGAISINKADLVVSAIISGDRSDSLTVPSSLIIFGINDDSTSYLLPDLVQSPYYFSGSYVPASHNYRLNISRYIQQVLDGKVKNNGVYLTVPHVPAGTTANRVVVGGGDDGTNTANQYKMKLEITYTKLH